MMSTDIAPPESATLATRNSVRFGNAKFCGNVWPRRRANHYQEHRPSADVADQAGLQNQYLGRSSRGTDVRYTRLASALLQMSFSPEIALDPYRTQPAPRASCAHDPRLETQPELLFAGEPAVVRPSSILPFDGVIPVTRQSTCRNHFYGRRSIVRRAASDRCPAFRRPA